MADKIFTNGLVVREPSEKVADFIKAKLSFNVKSFTKWMEEQQDEKGWVSVDILVSKAKGTWYGAKNEWVPKEKPDGLREITGDNIPF